MTSRIVSTAPSAHVLPRPSARTAMPAPIRDRYIQIPLALLEHRAALDLKPTGLWLVVSLQSFRWFADSKIRPSVGTLASRLGASPDTVTRLVKGLQARGLLIVRRAGPGPRARITEYDLTPLWAALAEAVSSGSSTPAPPTGLALAVPQDADAVLQNAGAIPQRAADLPRDVRDEVDDPNEDESEANEGGSTALTRLPPPAPRLTYSSEILPPVDEVSELRARALQPGTFPSVTAKLLDHADRAEARRFSERLDRLANSRGATDAVLRAERLAADPDDPTLGGDSDVG